MTMNASHRMHAWLDYILVIVTSTPDRIRDALYATFDACKYRAAPLSSENLEDWEMFEGTRKDFIRSINLPLPTFV